MALKLRQWATKKESPNGIYKLGELKTKPWKIYFTFWHMLLAWSLDEISPPPHFPSPPSSMSLSFEDSSLSIPSFLSQSGVLQLTGGVFFLLHALHYSHTYSYFVPLSLSLSLSLTHTHTHTHAYQCTPHHSLSFSHSLSQILTLYLSFSSSPTSLKGFRNLPFFCAPVSALH